MVSSVSGNWACFRELGLLQRRRSDPIRLSGALQWRHNGRDSVSNHQPHDCLLNRLFIRRSKKTSKLRVTGLCAGNSPGTGEFPAQMASYAENVSIWWRHHGLGRSLLMRTLCGVATSSRPSEIMTLKKWCFYKHSLRHRINALHFININHVHYTFQCW